MTTVSRDIRFALRSLRTAPLVSILAIACIGLGIGAVTTVYSTANAFTFRPLPQLADPGRVLVVYEGPSAEPPGAFLLTPGSFSDVQSLRDFSSVATLDDWTANIAGVDLPERAHGARVSADFFRLAGRTAALGRTFNADDILLDRRVVVLSDGLWRRRFGGEPGIVGKMVRINGEGREVVGVMPPDFIFPAGTQLWAPLALTPRAAADRGTRSLSVFARLAPGVTRERAAASLSLLGARIAADHPESHKGWVVRELAAEDLFGAGPRPFMIVLLASVAFLLLIACANVANLLLVRATARRREMGLRVALGATRGRLVAQLLTESLLLAVFGGALGIALAWVGIKATAATVPTEVQQYIPGFGAIVLDYRALIAAAVVSMLAGVMFGVVPALAASGVDVNTALKDGGRSESPRSRLGALRSTLVVAEIALALMLVAGGALMATTFRRLSLSDPGFRTADVLTGSVTLPEADYPGDSAVVRFWDRLRTALEAKPGVAAAEITSVLPMSWNGSRTRIYREGEKPDRPENAPSVGFRRVSFGYLESLDVGRVRGRSFANTDRMDAPLVVILSESAARRLVPSGDAVGKRFVIRDRMVTVVGIVRDVRGNPLTSDSPASVVYAPIEQWPVRNASVVLRVASGDPAAQTSALQRAIGSVDARLAAGEVMTMRRVVETVTSPQSATADMLLASALIALVMAAVGTYGVMAYTVSRRRQEIGIRMALGATATTVVRLVMSRAALLAGTGVVTGVVGAIALGRGMRAILFDTNPGDPVILSGAAVLLGAMALIAAWLPARRAARVNPVTALHGD